MEAEVEAAVPPGSDDAINDTTVTTSSSRRFNMALGSTCYGRGIVNVGVAASDYLGEDGEPALVTFQAGSPPVTSRINRTANRSGGVRLVGGNRAIAQWFQSNFREGDSATFEVVDQNNLRFLTT